MPWVRFTERYRHQQNSRSFKVYPSGWEGNVTTDCASAAKAAGKAVGKDKPSGTRISKSGEPYWTGPHMLTDPTPEPESTGNDSES